MTLRIHRKHQLISTGQHNISSGTKVACGGYAYPDLEAEPLMEEYLVAVASRDFVGGNPAAFAEGKLDGRWLLHDASPWQGATESEEWDDFASALGLGIRGIDRGRRFNLSKLAVDAALAGAGIAMGRTALVLDYIEAGRLVPVWRKAVRSKAS